MGTAPEDEEQPGIDLQHVTPFEWLALQKFQDLEARVTALEEGNPPDPPDPPDPPKPDPGVSGPPAGTNWTRTYDADFATMTALPPTLQFGLGTWQGVTNYDPGNREHQHYAPENILFEQGMCRIKCERSPKTINGRVYPYKSSAFSSAGSASGKTPFQQLGGYWEIRARMPNAGPGDAQQNGQWPAGWFVYQDDNKHSIWPPEVDIVEMFGQRPARCEHNLHLSADGQDFLGPPRLQPVPTHHLDRTREFWRESMHTFGCDWLPPTGNANPGGHLKFYLDGILTWTYTGMWIPRHPCYWLVNFAMGSDLAWVGTPPSDAVFPQYYDLAHLRVWQRA